MHNVELNQFGREKSNTMKNEKLQSTFPNVILGYVGCVKYAHTSLSSMEFCINAYLPTVPWSGAFNVFH